MKRVFKRFFAALLALCLLCPAFRLPARAEAPYYITVDITNQIVTVYDSGNIAQSGIVRQMICSTGRPGNDTPTGTFILPAKVYDKERSEWYYFPEYSCYAKWAVRIKGGILFHSVLYSRNKVGPTKASVNALGSRASHGCVRLRVADAKWIAQHCFSGTACRIYYSGKADADLRKRLLKGSFSRATQTYAEFMGRSDGLPLKKGSKGDRVRQLQARLQALGYYAGKIDGRYGATTATAVKRFEAAAGRKKTGVTNLAVWNAAFADTAPAGRYVTLCQGMKGPAVTALERTLQALKLYDGSLDGSFGPKVRQGVIGWQNYAGQLATGVATPAQQRAMAKLAAGLKAKYPDGQFALVAFEQDAPMARANRALKLYRKASVRAKCLGTLGVGDAARVLAQGKTWTKLRFAGAEGFVKTAGLDFFTGRETAWAYRGPGDDPTPTPDPPATPEIWLPVDPTSSPEVWLPVSADNDADGIPGDEPTPEPTPEPDPSLWEGTGVAGLTLADEPGAAPDAPDEGE